jgi:hypothetical protein
MKLNARIAAVYAAFIIAALGAYWTGIKVTHANSVYHESVHNENVLHGSPQRPPWVGADGVVDVSKMPECLPAFGANGETLVDKDGKPVCVSKDELLGASPASPPLQGKAPGEISRHVRPDGSEEVIVEQVKRRDQ